MNTWDALEKLEPFQYSPVELRRMLHRTDAGPERSSAAVPQMSPAGVPQPAAHGPAL